MTVLSVEMNHDEIAVGHIGQLQHPSEDDSRDVQAMRGELVVGSGDVECIAVLDVGQL